MSSNLIMAIPENITKEHIIQALSKIDKEGIPSDGKSQYYDVVLPNGKKYPPKLVVSYANIFANGTELDRSHFRGGLNTECFKLLKEKGFNIETKEMTSDFYEELEKFLKQAKTDNLKTKHFTNKYREINVKVSFGQGMPARIPWISFLIKPNTTANGIYPVYLYYKELNLLILSYGISETSESRYKWPKLDSEVKIKEYFKKEGLGEPVRYGESFVFKVYNSENLPSKKIIENDLDEIVAFYKAIMDDSNKNLDKQKISKDIINIQTDFSVSALREDLTTAGLIFSKQIVQRLISSLLTKPFVILTGLSGSGKTKLAQAFVQWICQDENQYRIIPVGADWTNREPLLGYPNALNPTEYVKPENKVLELMITAQSNPELPFFLILDEMNLSHVERYFADFLSVMESNEEIPLHAEVNIENGVPSKIKLPSNLFIIGTVNIDETTSMFSPKVLDRANTIEFRINESDMKSFLNSMRELNMEALYHKGANMAQDFLELSKNKSFATEDVGDINKTLLKFFGELKKTGAEFGYRTASEIMRLIHQLHVLDQDMATDDKIDIVIMQKLLPKLHGSRRKLCPILETLGGFCIKDKENIVKNIFDKDDFDFSNENEVLYPLSLEKISRMYNGAIDNGFTSFAEA